MNNNFKELTDFLDKYNKEYTIHSDCVEVKGDLYLSRNNIKSLPQSFGNLKIGGSLHLEYNKLTSLPESFGNLKIGGSLFLSNNNFKSLPDSLFTSGLYKKALDKNLDELYSNFLKRKEQEEMIRFKSQIWVNE